MWVSMMGMPAAAAARADPASAAAAPVARIPRRLNR
jgi:hypothetical protein